MEFALMFNVLEGGVSKPVKWGKENLKSDLSIIILDEFSLVVWLWHGSKQGLVARRTALRQAQSLKGHGYTVGKSIIGRDIKAIKEIDERKIGRDPTTDNINKELQELLNRDYKELENFIVTFSLGAVDTTIAKPEVKPEVKLEPKPEPTTKTLPKPIVTQSVEQTTTTINSKIIASEYETEEPIPSRKSEAAKSKIAPKEEKMGGEKPLEEARISFVIKAVLDHFSDVWVSKKQEGGYAIEMMDGPVCQFSIKEGVIKFTANSFSSISPNIKTEIQKKYIELSKLL
jgi:hypothetical protein